MNLVKPLVIGLEYRVSKNPKLLRKRLEAAGPTYIKMGQFVSNRPDIFGKELSRELSSLQDSVSWSELIIDTPKGVSNVSPVPIAAASIAQVHTGMYKGRQVVLKVKRPGIEMQLKNDLEGLRLFMNEAPKFMQDFEKSILKELDFKQEIRNIQEFSEIYDGTNVIVPTVYPEVSNDSVIVMDYVPSTGKLMSAERLINLFIEQMLFEDIIHGDMHSGNIGTIGNSIVLYDFGNVIRTTKDYRNATRDFVYHVQNRDTVNMIRTMKKMGMVIKNERVTRSFLNKLLKYLETLEISEFRFGAEEVDKIPVTLDPVTAAILRSFSLLEGYCKMIDPGFSYSAIIERNLELLFLDLDWIVDRFKKDLAKASNNI